MLSLRTVSPACHLKPSFNPGKVFFKCGKKPLHLPFAALSSDDSFQPSEAVFDDVASPSSAAVDEQDLFEQQQLDINVEPELPAGPEPEKFQDLPPPVDIAPAADYSPLPAADYAPLPAAPETSLQEIPSHPIEATPAVPESLPPPAEPIQSASEKYAEFLARTSGPPADDAQTDILADLSDAVTQFLTSISDSFESATSSLTSSLKSVSDSVTTSVEEVAKTSPPSLPALPTLPDALPTFSPPHIEVPQLITPDVAEGVNWVTQRVGETTLTALAAALQFLLAEYALLKSALPEDIADNVEAVESSVREVSAPAAEFTKQALLQLAESAPVLLRKVEEAAGLDPQDPVVNASITAAVLGIVLLFVAVSYWRSVLSGYSGDLSPEDTLSALKSRTDSVILDIRSEAQRAAQGVPDLRRAARGKILAVDWSDVAEAASVSRAVSSQLRDVDSVKKALSAAIVCGLKGLLDSGYSQVIVMDSEGSREAREIARSIQNFGSVLRTYRLSGGFKAWSSTQRTREDRPETALEVIQKETEAVIEEIRPTTEGVAAVSVGVVLAAIAISEWEKTLQFLGIVAIVQLVYIRLSSYESEEELKKDIKLLLSPIALLAAATGAGAAGASVPALPESSESGAEQRGGEEQEEPQVSAQQGEVEEVAGSSEGPAAGSQLPTAAVE